MTDTGTSERRTVGRPPRPMPEPIEATPEAVAQSLFAGPPKPSSEWRYLQKRGDVDS